MGTESLSEVKTCCTINQIIRYQKYCHLTTLGTCPKIHAINLLNISNIDTITLKNAILVTVFRFYICMCRKVSMS